MTKFEQELRRMFDHDAVFPNAKFVGNVCYGRLTDQIRVKYISRRECLRIVTTVSRSHF